MCSVDGRVIFATTNHVDRLDPALKRPGRFDVQISFTLACTEQIEGLFRAMMLPTAGEVERAIAQRAEARQPSTKVAEAGREDDAGIEQARRETVARLSKKFGEIVPEGTL